MQEEKDLLALANKVKTRDEFIELMYLLQDEYDKEGHTWDNKNIGEYLEGIIGGSHDIDGYSYQDAPPYQADQPSWSMFANILICATDYE